MNVGICCEDGSLTKWSGRKLGKSKGGSSARSSNGVEVLADDSRDDSGGRENDSVDEMGRSEFPLVNCNAEATGGHQQ